MSPAAPEPTIAEKLAALHCLGTHLGMWGRKVVLAETEALRAKRNPAEMLLMASVALDADVEWWRRQAAIFYLDFFDPEWKTVLPVSALGMVVERDDAIVRQWRLDVLERDGRLCQRCGANARLHAHHIVPWAIAPMLRLVLENGITLCRDCHADEHPTNGALRAWRN